MAALPDGTVKKRMTRVEKDPYEEVHSRPMKMLEPAEPAVPYQGYKQSVEQGDSSPGEGRDGAPRMEVA